MCKGVENSLIQGYNIGDRAETSKAISGSDAYLFAGTKGEMNPIHVNAIEAVESFAKRRITHGALGGGMISTVIGINLPRPGTIYMEQNSRFVVVKALKGESV